MADGGTGRERDARARRDNFRANSREFVDVDVEDARGERGERDGALRRGSGRARDDDGGADARVESQRRGVG